MNSNNNGSFLAQFSQLEHAFTHHQDNMVGTSKALLQIKKLIHRIAPSKKAVLITGPTGSGKELIAKSLHEQSSFAQGKLISINCGALPENLVDSLLFGHEKGAFTGADSKHIGYLGEANQGTLFLDELGEMPLLAQAKLLRVLETGKYTRVGGCSEQSFNGRIIAATHVDLEQAIQENRFREDLYFRLSVLTIETVPLTERQEDIPLLISFLAQQCERPVPFSDEAVDYLCRMDWPGNVRELKNTVERLCLLTDRDKVSVSCIQSILKKTPVDRDAKLDNIAKMILDTDVVNKKKAILDALILRAMKDSRGNKSKAAKLLGVHRKVVERGYYSYLEGCGR